MADAYTTGIRKALTQKGVANSDIGYNPQSGAVTVKGQDFLKGQKSYGGTNFTNQSSFNQAWDNYNKSQQSQKHPGYGGAPTASVGAYTGTSPTGVAKSTYNAAYKPPTTQQVQPQQPAPQVQQMPTQYNPYTTQIQQNPYTSQADAVIQQLLNYGQNQQNFDPYSSSGYRAAEAQANRQAQQGIRAAQESMGSAGFGRSTALGERSQGIANDATEYLMTQVVPQLEAQEMQRRQQEYNNILQALSPLMAQQGRGDELVQQDFANNLATAELTGNYMPQGAQDVISQLMALKQQAEAPTITRDARTGLSQQADTLRTQLQAMGVDPALFGANVSKSQAAQNVNRAGQRTQAAQVQDFDQATTLRQLNRADYESDRDYKFAVGQQEWENNFQQDQFNWQKAQQAWENAFQEKNFKQEMQEAAASRGLQWASLNQRQKEFVADQAFREKQFQYDVEQDKLKQSGGTTIGDKESVNNYNLLLEDIDSGIDKVTAQQLLQANSQFLTDSDYKKLNDYINKNL